KTLSPDPARVASTSLVVGPQADRADANAYVAQPEEATMTQTLITRAGLARLREELEHLTTTGRQEIAERIRHAVSSERNMVENGDYHDARQEQSLLERRIAILQERRSEEHTSELQSPDPLSR